ncbi:MAG: NUDIX hydrolase [Candidatus Andersenbacteria bacterium]
MSKKPPKGIPLHADLVFTGKHFSVWQWEQELYDGSKAIFEAAERRNAALAVGVLPNNNLLMILDEQPHREALIASPGGGLEPGESPETAVRREFQEETGYSIGQLIPWFTHVYTNKIHFEVNFFIAKDLTKIGEPTPDAGEKIELLEFSFDDFLQLAWNPKLRERELRITLLEALADPAKKKELHDLLFT